MKAHLNSCAPFHASRSGPCVVGKHHQQCDESCGRGCVMCVCCSFPLLCCTVTCLSEVNHDWTMSCLWLQADGGLDYKKHQGQHIRRPNSGCRPESRPPVCCSRAEPLLLDPLGDKSEKAKLLLLACCAPLKPAFIARCHFFSSLATGPLLLARGATHSLCIPGSNCIHRHSAL